MKTRLLLCLAAVLLLRPSPALRAAQDEAQAGAAKGGPHDEAAGRG